MTNREKQAAERAGFNFDRLPGQSRYEATFHGLMLGRVVRGDAGGWFARRPDSRPVCDSRGYQIQFPSRIKAARCLLARNPDRPS